MSIRSANLDSQAPKPLDSNRLFELEDSVRYEANWLIYLSILTIVAGFALSALLVAQGVVFLFLSIILKVKQSRSAALVLSASAAASCLVGTINLLGHGTGDVYIGLAQPALALLASVLAAVNAFRLHQALEVPLAANHDEKSDA
jgi:hypothetical protein